MCMYIQRNICAAGYMHLGAHDHECFKSMQAMNMLYSVYITDKAQQE